METVSITCLRCCCWTVFSFDMVTSGGQHRDAGVPGVQGLLGKDEEMDRRCFWINSLMQGYSRSNLCNDRADTPMNALY